MSDDGKPDLLRTLAFYGVDVQPSRLRQLVRCPVHVEDRASCSIDLIKNLYSCKACGSQGDAYTLICAKEGIGFREAVEFARERLGAEAPAAPRRRGRGGYRPKVRRGLRG